MRRTYISRRLGIRFGFTAGVAILLCVVVLFLVFLTSRRASSLRRVNVVLATSPVSLWSWDRQDGTFTVVSIPADLAIEATGGYGTYSVEAIWKLGFIEQATLLSSSLAQSIGIPVGWYMGARSGELTPSADVVAYGRGLFSLTRLPAVVFGRDRTNMPPLLFLSFSRALSRARADSIELVDLAEKSATREVEEPDTSKRRVMDPQLVDEVLKGMFEDPAIRKEGLSVALFNTTQAPLLGNRAARLLGSLGVLVVSVGNEELEVKKCQLVGGREALSTQTAESIAEVLDCDRVPTVVAARTDLIVRIGADYASLFSPRGGTGRP